MKFLWTTIRVSDLERSIAFYRDVLQLSMVERHPGSPGSEIAFMADGETRVELFCGPEPLQEGHAGDVSMGFACADLDSTRAALTEKGYAVSPIISPNPTIRFCFLQDPDGYQIQLAQQA